MLVPLPVDRVLAVRRRGGLVAVFDLDGTLAPIAPTPEAVHVPIVVRVALRQLAARRDTLAGIVSGRPLAQVERLVGRSGLWLAGVHGAVRRRPGGAVRRFWSAAEVRRGTAVAVALRAAVRDIPGALVERKGPVVAAHVRLVRPGGVVRVAAAVEAVRPRGWHVLAGRRVFELRPPRLPTKADAVGWMAARRPDWPVLYVGDDATDEEAFAALGARDFTVAVDPTHARRERGASLPADRARLRRLSPARFALPDPAAVGRLVVRLADTD